MLGVVFTEFVEMVEDSFGEEVADEMLEMSKLASGGVYTAVGTYSYQEISETFTQNSLLDQVMD